MCVVAYAFCPIDLIPDPVPILGYLDDLVLIPLGIYLARRMIPANVLDEYRDLATNLNAAGMPVSRVAAAVIVGIWLVTAVIGTWLLWRMFEG
jgi:uncharacterized membrane protein YkvA (DUF1232 family)